MKFRPIAIVAAMLWLPAGEAVSGSSPNFHPPATNAEQALDRIIKKADTSEHIIDYALNRPRDKRKDARYGELFTPVLLKAWAAAEAALIADSGDMGLSFNPITCAQDMSEQGYSYRTEKEKDDVAVIAYRWRDISDLAPIATYRLTRQDKGWSMDGVSCELGDKFNMR